MAKIDLWKGEAHDGKLPAVCVVCGKVATTYKDHTVFVGLGGLPFVIIPPIYVLAGRIWLKLPFCRPHMRYWLWRRSLAYGTFVVALITPIIGMGFTVSQALASPSKQFPQGHPVFWLAFLSLFAPFVWLIWILIYRKRGIRVTGYDDAIVSLDGVNSEFVDAVAIARHDQGDSVSALGPVFLPPVQSSHCRYHRRADGSDEHIQ